MDKLEKNLKKMEIRWGIKLKKRIGRVEDKRKKKGIKYGEKERLVNEGEKRWIGINFKVESMKKSEKRSGDGKRKRIRNRMGEREGLNIEREELKSIEGIIDSDRNLRRNVLRMEIGLKKKRYERSRIEGKFKERKKIKKRKKMILMRMGDENEEKIVILRLEIENIRKNEVGERMLRKGKDEKNIKEKKLEVIRRKKKINGKINEDLE